MYRLVLLRHGESDWNRQNRFTGWKDVDLTEQGRAEASEAGRLMAEAGLSFDIAYTSVLKRAIRTLWLALDEMDLMWIPVVRHWRLNERHYGALQGLDKAETAAEHGDEQVHIWRRSYDIAPPPLAEDDERHAIHDPRYAGFDRAAIPDTECLKDVVERFLPYWNDIIVPTVRSGRQALIAAHGNSLRALVKHLEQIGDDEIMELNIPTGVPLVYELDDDLRAVSSRYLGDPEKIKQATAAVAAQGKAR